MQTRVRHLLWLGIAAIASACAALPATAPGDAHIVYLHGKVVQEQGIDASSPEYGRYAFREIVAALGADGARVHAPVRAPGATVKDSAEDVAALVRELIASGVAAQRITVVAVSHGAVIAMRASTALADARLSFVLMGACNDWTFNELRPQLHGRILSIYERGDTWGESCRPLVDDAPGVRAFEEIELRTGLAHGYIYRPLPEWVVPTLAWTRN